MYQLEFSQYVYSMHLHYVIYQLIFVVNIAQKSTQFLGTGTLL